MPQVRFPPEMWRWVLFAMAAAPSPGGKPESGRPPPSTTFPHPLSLFLLRFKQSNNASKWILTIYCGIWWINRTLELINQEKVAQPLKRQTILSRGNQALSTSVSGRVSNHTNFFNWKTPVERCQKFQVIKKSQIHKSPKTQTWKYLHVCKSEAKCKIYSGHKVLF